MRIALGTAQFGMPYGVTNAAGVVSPEQVKILLDIARTHGVDTLDTAIAYGHSEDVLGQVGTDGFRIITKLPAVPEGTTDVVRWVREQVRGSLDRLKRDQLDALLLHRSQQLAEDVGDDLQGALVRLCDEGLIRKVGVSIYDPSELELIPRDFPLGVVQAPVNVLDRRLETSGWLARLQDRDVEVHARSVFLQGLLILTESTLPAKFNQFRPLWVRWHAWLAASGLTSVGAALRYACGRPGITRIVVGVVNDRELLEVLALGTGNGIMIPVFGDIDPRLLNPSRWGELDRPDANAMKT